jgi:DNA-binding NarL/FixJ family response regulator
LTSPGISCVVADDHPILLNAICSVLSKHGVSVVGTAERGADALELIRRTSPTVALIDLKMPGISGMEIARTLSEDGSTTGVILYTGFGNNHNLSEAIAAGAKGFIKKDAAVEEVLLAVEMVSAGKPYIDPTLAASMLDQRDLSKPVLSSRELQVIELVAGGHTTESIGVHLSVSSETVQTHVQAIMRKLGAGTRSQAVAMALRETIIT